MKKKYFLFKKKMSNLQILIDLNNKQKSLNKMSNKQKEEFYKQKALRDFDDDILAFKPINMSWQDFESKIRELISIINDLSAREVVSVLIKRNRVFELNIYSKINPNYKIDDYLYELAEQKGSPELVSLLRQKFM